jgi:hypothetical protein
MGKWDIEKIVTDGLPGGTAIATVTNTENNQTEKVVVNSRSDYGQMVEQVGAKIAEGDFKR